MSTSMSLSGTWVGEYFQHGRPHVITADLHQSGDELSGSMRDGEPDKEMSVTEVTSDDPGLDERITARLRAMFPDAPAEPIRYISHLPTESSLEGWVKGTGVYFLKSYRGASFGGFKVGDRVIGHRVDDHVVHYSGRVGAGGDEIEGRWWIGPTTESGGQRTEGSFRLRRQRREGQGSQ
jgi:hypothetical protein